MTIAVLINNYNYGRFLVRCLESVLSQTRRADQVVVVDDGSTDDSLEVLRRFALDHPGFPLEIAAKQNGGQLSAFNLGASLARADLVCFLDSDDEYLPGYLQQVESTFRDNPGTDVLFASYSKLYEDGRREPIHLPCAELPPQLLETAVLFRYCGGPTSTIAMTAQALGRLLPGDNVADWRVSADDVLVMKAAALGMRRRTVPGPQVLYRIHGNNLFHGKRPSRAERERRRLRRASLLAPQIEHLMRLSDRERLALHRVQLRAAPRTAVAAWRQALLVLRLPVGARGRGQLAAAYLGWLLGGPAR
jgi:glycosyltransferase involved in cell wall biosynthesis